MPGGKVEAEIFKLPVASKGIADAWVVHEHSTIVQY